jgi:CDGSH-type Zn-finger protein/uncharacterized Fe-S cluster protein YjdI
MTDKIHTYVAPAIDVTFDKSRCVHVGACIRGLPRVFDPGSRPWVMPGNGTADRVAATVEQCPSGALQYLRKDGGPAEQPDAENTVRVSRHGPLFLRGQLELVQADGTARPETRLALCRCGVSGTKPFCDNSHLKVRFQDEAKGLAVGTTGAGGTDASGPLRIEPQEDGPVQLRGSVRVIDATGVVAGVTTRAALCRCGQSGTKPFCDGSHARAGFRTG